MAVSMLRNHPSLGRALARGAMGVGSLAIVLLPATLAAAASRGAHATTASMSSKAQLHIVLGTPAGDHGAITVGPINNMAEGDTVARVVELTNNTNVGAAGTTGLAAVNGLTLKTSVSGSNAGSDIVTDTTNGLHVTVQSCATAPTETGGVAGPWTYACTGGFTSVVNNVALGTLNGSVSDMTSSAPIEGASTYYVITVTLPSTYADAYSYNSGACSTGGTAGVSEQLMNCSLSVTYNFTATQ
ncbi:MAG: hypothetical protein WB592_16735 [Acidimicrobiales bacterium]|jgi:hypothetical protein